MIMNSKYQRNNSTRKILISLLLLLSINSFSQDMEKVLDLKGMWKFSIGDNSLWAEPTYDDSQWEMIYVPKMWEEQGFNGYDGYAWYRKQFSIPSGNNKANYYLQLGYIDDVDKVYLNGKLIGQTGSFPPNFSTAYNANRIYSIPSSLINKNGANLLAVKVYDVMGEGGIIHGDIALMVVNTPVPDLDLQGKWKFKTTNCDGTQPATLNYETWGEIVVPGYWDDQGYKYFDGIATYVKEFKLNGQFKDKKMVLMLGKIDDLDQVYLNGVLVGQSINFEDASVGQYSQTYTQFRGYYLPDGVLNQNGKNILIVKVYDEAKEGGIYAGPVGLITQGNYIQFWRLRKKLYNLSN